MRFLFLIILLLSVISINAQSHKVIESTSSHLIIELDFNQKYNLVKKSSGEIKYISIEGEENYAASGEPSLPEYSLNFGLPLNSKPLLKIIEIKTEKINDVFILPVPDSLNQEIKDLSYKKEIYSENKFYPAASAKIENDVVFRYLRIGSLRIFPYQFNPVTRELMFNRKIIVKIDFDVTPGATVTKVTDPFTEEYALDLVNNLEAKNFIGTLNSVLSKVRQDTFWYNPEKDYFKIFLKEKGLYRITFEDLITAGVPTSGLTEGKLELFCNGERVPIDISDNNADGLFNSGDYFQFIGFPAKPSTPYTYLNIYNNQNVYWFSYQADSLFTYEEIDGNPTNFDNQITTTLHTIHYEEDRLYERLGYAQDDKRDFWFWGSAEARNGQEYSIFTYWIRDSIIYYLNPAFPQSSIRVSMQGITNIACGEGSGHSAFVKLNANKIGEVKWDGQNSITLQCDFTVFTPDNPGGIPILSTLDNKFEVGLDGDICSSEGSDLIRINWFELDYWRWNSVKDNKFIFKNPPERLGKNTYYLYNWYDADMRIYIPQRNQLITNPLVLNDADKSVIFSDSISERTEYFCYSKNSFLTPSSIIKDQSSDLHSINNGADYIIITHSEFYNSAEKLANFRSTHLKGFDSPRIKLIDVTDIYDEFSFGLLDPFALKNFASHIFTNWQKPSPLYIVLFGDMSFDYRKISGSSRYNYIPSIPYQAYTFGQLPSDNLIVAVSGTDGFPDMAIGRLSCETIEEAEILVNKIINYPADNNKNWKENVLLLSSGLSDQDQRNFGFNQKNNALQNNYLNPNGFVASKVFNFISDTADAPYRGSGPKMRSEINKGAVITNYYGHGGGGQWDLVFIDDDIYELSNEDRLPLILSITCYTAHFDNQDCFGEKFIKVPGKGAIGFWGSTGLTYWNAGVNINEKLFNHIFNNKEYVIGNAILKAKGDIPPSALNNDMIAQLSFLGDPALELALPASPDFEIKSSDITIQPENPLSSDTVIVSIRLKNLGITFPDDSVTVELFHTNSELINLIGTYKISSFGQEEVITFNWIPGEAGLYNLIARVNQQNEIEEYDFNDNTATASFSVFDFDKPSIVKPFDGFYTNKQVVDFVIIDAGLIFNKDLKYLIEIDKSLDFNSPVRSSQILPVDGVVNWSSPILEYGEYFWRALVFDDVDTNYSSINTFTIGLEGENVFSAQQELLNLFDKKNIVYSDSLEGLIVNTGVLPPLVQDPHILDSIMITLPVDSTKMTTLTTDGTYLYFGHLQFYTNRNSRIYKVGTGFNGSVKGQIEAIPNVEVPIKNQIIYFDGYIYAATGSLNSLLRIDPSNGDTLTILLPDQLLPSVDGLLKNEGIYLATDGELIYNLSAGTQEQRNKYILRKLDPFNEWKKAGEDIILSGTSDPGFTNFFVTNNYIFTYESYNVGYMRRHRLTDGVYEEEFIVTHKFPDFYCWSYDWQNNFLYAGKFRPGTTIYSPGIYKYIGNYKNATGILSKDIGPASEWNLVSFNLDSENSSGTYSTELFGRNNETNEWEKLAEDFTEEYSLENINANDYNFLRFIFTLKDSSILFSEPLVFKSLKVYFQLLPEIVLSREDFSVSPDSVLQGLSNDFNLKISNVGYSTADSLSLNFYINNEDSSFYNRIISIPADSSIFVNHSLITSNLFDNQLKAIAVPKSGRDLFSFNNITEKSFYVIRDSLNPVFSITADGEEILDGDIISANPEVVISLKDNSPLPLDTSLFTIVYFYNEDFQLINFNRPDIEYSYTPYPNSEMIIKWKPVLGDGEHSLSILAKDASGNFFDSTNYQTTFYVFNEPDLLNVFNYPNPFRNDTYFTFELHGVKVPDEFYIKIYTVAGRLIRDLKIPSDQLKIGLLNRVYWDGRDEDGDEVANGVYFYKIVAKINDVIKTHTEKLAKVK